MEKQRVKMRAKIMISIIMPILIVILIFSLIISIMRVQTSNMEPTIKKEDITFTNKLSKDFQRGDIILFSRDKKYFQARIIGVPGDNISLSGGQVAVNGEVLEESYLSKDTKITGEGTFHVPDNTYFVMGNNKDDIDGFGECKDLYVKQEEITGRTFLGFGMDGGLHMNIL